MREKNSSSEPVKAALLLVCFAFVLVVLWKAHSALLVLAAGLLIAAVFHALADLLEHYMGLSRKLAAVIVFITCAIALILSFSWGGAKLVSQFDELTALMSDGRKALDKYVSGLTIGSTELELPRQVSSYLPDIGSLVSSARATINMTLGALGNFLIMLVIGAFVTWNPGSYRRGLISLFPKEMRERMNDALLASADAIHSWIGGQAVSMLIIFVTSWFLLWLIGMPLAFLLALQAGLLAFIPTIGPFIAGIPMLLTGITVSPQMALIALMVYLAIQTLESNIIMPIVQRKATSLPPALTLGFQIIFGALFGLIGLVMAVPVLVLISVLVQKLYVDDLLGGKWQDEKASQDC